MKKIIFNIDDHSFLREILSEFTQWYPGMPHQNTCSILPYLVKAFAAFGSIVALFGLVLGCMVDFFLYAGISWYTGTTHLGLSNAGVAGAILNILLISGLVMFVWEQYCSPLFYRWFDVLCSKPLFFTRKTPRPARQTREPSFLSKIYQAMRDKVCIEIEVVDNRAKDQDEENQV